MGFLNELKRKQQVSERVHPSQFCGGLRIQFTVKVINMIRTLYNVLKFVQVNTFTKCSEHQEQSIIELLSTYLLIKKNKMLRSMQCQQLFFRMCYFLCFLSCLRLLLFTNNKNP